MKSFRLDPDSVAQLGETWPGMLVGGLMAILVARFRPARLEKGATAAVIVAVICLVYLALNLIRQRLQEHYPGARSYWLLKAGHATFLGGFALWMLFRNDLGRGVHLAWLGASFGLILSFVLINRKNEFVTR